MRLVRGKMKRSDLDMKRSDFNTAVFFFSRLHTSVANSVSSTTRGGRLLGSGTRLPPPPSLPSGPT